MTDPDDAVDSSADEILDEIL
ncbi:MAG: hypothetical protein QOG99_3756, partial [Frankiales bacterium]|nr:hypothetical protein [Frankiales bacterium]